jgi:site-specific DNA-cytosine methylase
MRALSIIGGTGSMLIGAKEQGYEILGGFDWRKYYHTGTFEFNFGTPLFNNYEDLKKEIVVPKDLDLIIGHTECGFYSRLNQNKDQVVLNKGDIPIYMGIVKDLQPKFFVMDNLPDSLQAVNAKEWEENFPNYDIFFEWISNFNYGNTQKGRNRLFVIGAKKEFGFFFVPNEKENNLKFKDIISGLPPLDDILKINHVHKNDNHKVNLWHYNIDPTIPITCKDKIILKQYREFLKDYPKRKTLNYYTTKRKIKYKFGSYIMDMDYTSFVLTGGMMGTVDHLYRPDTLLPLTIRERARIQGAPDDYIFQPYEYINDEKIYKYLITQTGKFMPVQFTSFLTKQIKDFLEGNRDLTKYTKKRLIVSHELINFTKWRYCQLHNYSNKESCNYCNISCCNKR